MNEKTRNEYKKNLQELRHQISSLEVGLDQDAGEDNLIRHLAHCRATVNTMLARATGDATEAKPRDAAPAWKSAAARKTK